MANVLVIGSKGFIGNHIHNYFKQTEGYNIWGCDVVVDYNDKQYSTIDASNSNFHEIFETISFDYCINCSGAASVPDSLVHPFRDFTLNVQNVFKILEAIRRLAPCCKFINLSSAAVYGNPQNIPICETDPCKPLSPYGRHKLMAEEICSEYYEHFHIPTCALRIFSAYGIGQKKQLLWDIYQKAQGANVVNLYGTGNESRDFIYIEDIAQAIELVMKRGDFNGCTYNLANGEEVTTKQIAETLLGKINYNGEIKFNGTVREGDPLNWQADITKLIELGYTPRYSITTGITKYIEWLEREKLA